MDALKLIAGIVLMLAMMAGEIYLAHQVFSIASRLLGERLERRWTSSGARHHLQH